MFSPGFAVGAVAYNHLPCESVCWGLGVFYNDISEIVKERIDDNQGINIDLRGVWTPWFCDDGQQLVHLGLGYGFVDLFDDRARFRVRPEVHENSFFLDTGWFPSGYFHRTSGELLAIRGPLSLQAEAVWVHTDGRDGTPAMDFPAAYAYASLFLTGEHRPYLRDRGVMGRVVPRTNFFLTRTPCGAEFGPGAWEILARWSWIGLDGRGLDSPGRGELHDLTVGRNWYWTPHVRWLANWIHTFGDRADVGPNEADILGVRMQFDF